MGVYAYCDKCPHEFGPPKAFDIGRGYQECPECYTHRPTDELDMAVLLQDLLERIEALEKK